MFSISSCLSQCPRHAGGFNSKSGDIVSRSGSTEEHAVTGPTVHRTRSAVCPQLTIATSGLYIHETHADNPTTIHAAPSCKARVINTLLRVVHGGSPGWGSLGWGSLPDGYLDNLYPAENPKRNRIVFDGLPNEHNRKSKSRREEGQFRYVEMGGRFNIGASSQRTSTKMVYTQRS